MANADIVKNTRVEFKEDVHGRVRERTVTTWDVVKDGELLHTFDRKRDALAALKRQATVSQCPGCNGSGVLTDDPDVLRCLGCGGVFTSAAITVEQAIKFVRLHLPMLANAGADGAFYFDLVVKMVDSNGPRPARRIHGWADIKTKKVVQFG